MGNGKKMKKAGCILLAALLVTGILQGRVSEGVLASDVQDAAEVKEDYEYLNVYINEEGALEQWYEVGGDWFSDPSHETSYWKVKDGSYLVAAGADESNYNLKYEYDATDGVILTLKDFQMESRGQDGENVIYSDAPLTLQIEGTNEIVNPQEMVLGVMGSLTIKGNGSLSLVTNSGEREDDDGETYIPTALEVYDVYEKDEEGNWTEKLSDSRVTIEEGVTVSCSSRNPELSAYLECGLDEFNGSVQLEEGQKIVFHSDDSETVAASIGSGTFQFETTYFVWNEDEEPATVYMQVVTEGEKPVKRDFGSNKIYPSVEIETGELADEIRALLSPEAELIVFNVTLTNGETAKELKEEGEELILDFNNFPDFENPSIYYYQDGNARMMASMDENGYLGCLADSLGTYFIAEGSGLDSYWTASDSFWKAMEVYWSKYEAYCGAEEKGITGALQAYEDAKEDGQDIAKILTCYQNACDAYDAAKDAASDLTKAYEALRAEYQALSAIERTGVKEDHQSVETDYEIAMESCSEEVLEKPSPMAVSEESKVQAESGAPKTLLHTGTADILGSITLTQEEKEAILDGKTTDIVLTVKNTQPNADEKKLIEGKLDGYEAGQYLDLTLLLNIGEDYSKAITDLEQPVRITITIPESLVNKDAAMERNYRVIRIHNGAAALIDGTYDKANGTLTFETDQFSVYAIVYKDTEKSNQDLNNTESEGGSETQNTEDNPASSQGTGDTQSGASSSQGMNETQSGASSSQGNETQSGASSSQGNETQSGTSSNTGDISSSVYGMLLLIGMTAVLMAVKGRKTIR